VEVVPYPNPAAPPPRFDQHLSLLSAPLALRLIEPLSTTAPYLHADGALRAAWRQRLGPVSPFRVGLAWAGNPKHPNDRNRSIGFTALDPILHVPGVDFYSLQIANARVLPSQLSGAGILDFTTHLSDFADTAALMAELDLIITVDTAVAHLAGALGRRVWTLLPFVPDWRWGLAREDTPWYPTMRLFRQTRAGDWEAVIQRVAGELSRVAVPGRS
jgi:hypothetical protein